MHGARVYGGVQDMAFRADSGGTSTRLRASSVSVADDLLEAELVARYDELLRLATLLTGDRNDGDDVVQSAVERAWRARRDLRDPERAGAWLRRIVMNEALRSRRGRPRVTVLAEDLPSASGMPGSNTLDLAAAFDRLPADQRAVVALHTVLGYRVDEVAELVNAPRETVRSRLRLAIARMRREVEA